MARIGQTEWDTEQLTDRVDVIRHEGRQATSRQNIPVPVTVAENVPCLMVGGGAGGSRGKVQIDAVSDLSVDQVAVGFADVVFLKDGDILTPKPPSIGPNLRVGPFRYESQVDLYLAICTRTT